MYNHGTPIDRYSTFHAFIHICQRILTTIWISLFASRAMKRLKRFVLAEKTEKNLNWKSSDNLLARISKNMSKNGEEDSKPEEEDTDESQSIYLSTTLEQT